MTANLRRRKLAVFLYGLTLVGLLGYSFSQVDLNLTLSSNPWYQIVQQRLIFLGYFKRQTSTFIYLFLLLLLFICQGFFFLEAKRKKVSENFVWKLSLLSCSILLFSYPAFSYDIFNYIFDTRILVTHHLNPWKFTALDFPHDLWTRFMRWTHRTYPYGPAWLLLTIPFYFFGAGKFTFTLLAYKLLGAVSYLVCIWAIRKILKAISSKETVLGMIVFALNPLVIIESLVNAHLDVTMAALLLIAVLFRIRGKIIFAWIFFILSAGIKFVTASALPAWVWWKGRQERFQTNALVMLGCISIVTLIVIIYREPLPWYLVTPLAVVALLPQQKALILLAQALSLGMMLRYAPYLLHGDYSDWVRTTRDLLTIMPLLLSVGVLWIKRKNYFSVCS